MVKRTRQTSTKGSSTKKQKKEDSENETLKEKTKKTTSKNTKTKKIQKDESKQENTTPSMEVTNVNKTEETRAKLKRVKSRDLSKMAIYKFDRDAAYHSAVSIESLLDECNKAKKVEPISEKSEIEFPRYLASYIFNPKREGFKSFELKDSDIKTPMKVNLNVNIWGEDHISITDEKSNEIASLKRSENNLGMDHTLYLLSTCYGLQMEYFLIKDSYKGEKFETSMEYSVKVDIFISDWGVSSKEPEPENHRYRNANVVVARLFGEGLIGTSKWDIERLLWIGFYKGSENGCPFSYLPRDVMRIIVTYSRTDDISKEFELVRLLESIRPSVEAPQVKDPPGLSCALRPFQRKALHWMLRRECLETIKGSDALRPSWIEIKLPKYGKIIYYHPGNGIFSVYKFTTPPTRPGGLLCDEMGLGKTVEICSLIMAHPRSPGDFKSDFKKLKDELEFDAPETTQTKQVETSRSGRIRKKPGESSIQEKAKRDRSWQPDPVPIGATIIITPQSILHQWFIELQKHMPEMKVYYYAGMNSFQESQEINTMGRSTSIEATPPKLTRGKSGGLHFDPSMFAEYDIVLTTYSNLQKDLKHHTTARPSPLICVEWWRIVLDEAQMVSKSNSETAHMAACLWGANRWCVTGTPIGNSLSDLHGLLDFLYHNPYSDKKIWNGSLLKLYNSRHVLGLQAMRRFLKTIMWRHTKNHVQDELQLPPSTDRVIDLKLSKEEDLYYRHLYRSLVYKLGKNENLQPQQVLQLRQTCCHPQLGGANTKELGKRRISLNEVVQRMLDRSLFEYELSIRDLVTTLCKTASMYWNPKPYEATFINPDTGNREAVCNNPPPKNIPKAIEILKEALSELENYIKSNVVIAELPVNSLRVCLVYVVIHLKLSVLNALVRADSFNAFKYHPTIQEVRSAMKIIGDPMSYIALYENICFPTHSPEQTAQSTIDRNKEYIKECYRRLEHIRTASLGSKSDMKNISYESIFSDESEKKEESKENPKCPICSETEIETAVISKCGHIFCADCILGKLSERPSITCPTCSAEINKGELTHEMATIDEDSKSEEKTDTEISVEEYGTKVTTLVKMLKEFKEKDSTTKSVIFSQWNQLLDLISDAFEKSGIKFTRMQGSEEERTRAISDFQSDESVSAFLISMKWNAGLTLTCAQNCFIMEPSPNPAIEEQATNRVYRIGQTKPTFIYRFIMKGTIEERILKMQERKRELEETSRDMNSDDILKHEDIFELLE